MVSPTLPWRSRQGRGKSQLNQSWILGMMRERVGVGHIVGGIKVAPSLLAPLKSRIGAGLMKDVA